METHWFNPRIVPKCVPGPKSGPQLALSTFTKPSVSPHAALGPKVSLDVDELKRTARNLLGCN